MKKILLSLAAAAATVTAVAAVPTIADAQPRYWHGPAHGPGYNSWRHGYHARYNRYPARFCEIRHGRRVCFYR